MPTSRTRARVGLIGFYDKLYRRQNQLSTIKGLGAAGFRGAFYAPNPMHRFKGIARKPVFTRLRLKMLHEQLYFSTADFFGERDK